MGVGDELFSAVKIVYSTGNLSRHIFNEINGLHVACQASEALLQWASLVLFKQTKYACF
jgi:hypothetical protein